MKPHESKKQGQNKSEKEGAWKQRTIKKPNWKKRKGNKTLSQKAKRGGKKTWQKSNKREGIEDQGSSTWIASFHSLISNASSLVIYQSFKSLFTNSSYVKFGFLLPLFSLSDSSHVKFGLPLPLLIIGSTPLWIGASAGLRWICPNHLKRCCTSFSSTGATPSLSRISSFWIRSLLVWP
jgi:hypothetical protein